MAVEDLYREAVLAHNRAPQRFGELQSPTHAGDGENPACGDALHVGLRVADGRIADLRFKGEACAVTIAAASMLGELIVGGAADRLQALRGKFERLLRGESGDPSLGELAALSELTRHPARHRCALLAFDAVQAALSGSPTDPRAAGSGAGSDVAGGLR